MIKISRPVLYTIVAGVAAYAVVLLTEPEVVPKKKTITAKAAAAPPNGFTAEDMTAHFPRYAAHPQNAFMPKVISARAAAHSANTILGKAAPGDQLTLPGVAGIWKLTGVSAINGVPSALLENGNVEDSIFLQAGDTWHGLHVLSVDSGAVVFENVLGQRTRLPFPDPEAVPSPGTVPAPGAVPSPGAVPGAPTTSLSGATPIPTKILSPLAATGSSASGLIAPATVTIEGNRVTVQPTTARNGRRGRNVN